MVGLQELEGIFAFDQLYIFWYWFDMSESVSFYSIVTDQERATYLKLISVLKRDIINCIWLILIMLKSVLINFVFLIQIKSVKPWRGTQPLLTSFRGHIMSNWIKIRVHYFMIYIL